MEILLLAMAVAVVAMFVKYDQERKRAESCIESMNKLKRSVEPLYKYQKIVHVEAEIKQMHLQAQRAKTDYEIKCENLVHETNLKAKAIKDDAENYAMNLTLKVEEETKQLKRETKEKTDKQKQKAQEMLDNAIEESERIVKSAKDRAIEIAGDAIKAKENSDRYEKTAKAMKNIIDGYGDQYIIPNNTVLDELAEDFSHKEAGAELKKIRSQTKSMVTNGIAAKCDYVETHRKTTAINFVLDAFNGKVDTILTKTKHNNYGKLKQQITDAYNLVNHNGKAFRNARIEPDYLNNRMQELKWAVAVNELQLQEREEQRRIKEIMREEEKARKEYEKAMKEAEKEERMLKKAMEQAQKKFNQASEEQKQKYEMELNELLSKLSEAEQKNQRALSMAQQTKTGHVYIISNIGSFGEDVFKIGLTRRLDPLDRVKELGNASVPFLFDVHAMLYSEDSPALENEIHKKLASHQLNKINNRKEFFKVNLKDIREIVEEMGIEVHWTMVAEAKEYRESLALGDKNDDVL
ncbi:DUF4041 domain-containing protein [Candidatus Uabimicrobium amorphum]|uniref:Chromosome segregation ATPase n=1 Tax=Uabimicrobium amorphum TaxID=2596890 RepID=A0A5S9ITH3_UABAM|nr:DUF4041 domain-containing protein [Candidatus Uabimicrobium amorphum]BBM86335.1 chromosome segregation ATPase [Candidatus Uabimicrobium amorphum]